VASPAADEVTYSGSASPGSEHCQSSGCAPCTFTLIPGYIQADTIFLWRSIDHFTPNAGIGPQLTIGLFLDPKNVIEGRYFSALGMDGAPYLSGATSRAQSNYYSSDLHNAEINYLHTWNNFSLLGGFRFLRLNETTIYRADNYNYWYSYSTNDSEVNNDLYGGQIGLRWKRINRRFIWEATGKFGVFDDEFRYQQLSRGEVYYSHYNSSVSLLAELNVSGTLRFTRDWGLRCGYNLLYLSQLGPRNGGDENVIFNGLNAGLQGQW
jgi:hypothetical protein